MLEDAAGIRRVVIVCGCVDLRKGIDGLSMIIGDRYHQNPFEKGTLFLFCGRSLYEYTVLPYLCRRIFCRILQL